MKLRAYFWGVWSVGILHETSAGLYFTAKHEGFPLSGTGHDLQESVSLSQLLRTSKATLLGPLSAPTQPDICHNEFHRPQDPMQESKKVASP